MKVKLRVLGVPLHPLLVHLPIASWIVVPLLDIAALYAGPDFWWNLSEGSVVVGSTIGAASIATGLLDYVHPSLAGIDLKLAARHGVRTSLAWCVFSARAAVAAFVSPAPWFMISCLIIDLLGCALLIQGVYFGTRQVYQQLEHE